MKIGRHGLTLQSLFFVGCVCFGPVAGIAESREGPGWEEVWHNQVDSARMVFEGRLITEPEDVRARQGLILCQLYRGYEREVLEQLEQLSKQPDAGMLDVLLTTWVYNLIRTSGRDEKLFQRIYENYAQKKIGALERRVILARLARHATANGDVGKVERVTSELGRIGTWSILGPFDNVSGSGHRKNHVAPGLWWSADEVFDGKAGQSFRWHNPEVLSISRSINFGNHFQLSRHGTFYAGCELLVSEPGSFVFSFSKSGALAAEIDSREILKLDKVSTQREFYHVEVDLPVGRHTLLVKVSSKESEPMLAVGVTASHPDLAGAVSFNPLVPGEGVAADLSHHVLPLDHVTELSDRALSDTADAFAVYMDLVSMILYDQQEELPERAERAVERFPGSGLIHHVAAVAYGQTDDDVNYRHHVREAVHLDPDNSRALLSLAHEEERKRNHTAVDTLLERATRGNGRFVGADMLRLASLADRGMNQETFALAENLQKDYPGFAQPLETLADYYEAIGDKSKESGYRRKALKAITQRSALVSKLSDAQDASDQRESIKHLKRLQDLYPDAPELFTGLAKALLQKGDAEGGIELSDRAAEVFPYRAEALFLKAYIEDLRSAVDESRQPVARQYYKRALALSPWDFEIRDKLRQLEGQPPVNELLPPYDFGAIRAADVSTASHPGKDACVLQDERRRIVFEDGTTYGERLLVIKVLTIEGAERYGTIRTGLHPIFSDPTVKTIRTVKPDGREIEGTMIGGTATFQSLEPADIIEFHYGINSWSPGALNRDFWDQHFFQWSVPGLVSRYVLFTAGSRSVRSYLHNCANREEVIEPLQSVGEFTRQAWTLRDMPARPSEPLAPPSRDVAPWLDVSTLTWENVVQWYRDLSTEPAAPDHRVRAKVKELTEGLSDQREMIERLCSFVTNEIVYEDVDFDQSAYTPEAAPDVLTDLHGDCKDQAGLLCAMLRAIGVESHFALVSPVSSGVTPYLPSPRFSHCIIALADSTEILYVDATARGMPFGRIPRGLCGAPVLVINEETIQLDTIPHVPMAETRFCTWSDAALDPNRQMTIHRVETYKCGDDVARLRSALSGLVEEERESRLAEELGLEIVGARIARSSWEGLKGDSDSICVRYDIIVENAVTPSGSMMTCSVPWRTQIGGLLAACVAREERTSPLALSLLAVEESDRVTVTMPEGWNLLGVPDPEQSSCSYGEFQVSFLRNGPDLIAQRSLTIRPGTVPPADYHEFKEFLESVLRAQNTTLVLAFE